MKLPLKQKVLDHLLATRDIPKTTDRMLDALTPTSQNGLLRSQTSLKVNLNKGSLNLNTSRFGYNLSENKDLPKANFYSIAQWGKWRGISEAFFVPITISLIKKPRNPHKGWFNTLKDSIVTLIKTGVWR